MSEPDLTEPEEQQPESRAKTWVRYTGTADERGFLASQLVKAGVPEEDAQTVWWGKANGLRVPKDYLTEMLGEHYHQLVTNDRWLVEVEEE